MSRMNRLKALIVLAGLTLLLAFSGLALAAEFSADMIHKSDGMTTKGKIYVKGKKMRMEKVTSEGKAITIMHMDTGDVWIIHPAQKMYMDMKGMGFDASALQSDEEISKIAEKKHLGTEKVSGYKCEKYFYIYHDKSLGTTTQWVSRKLDYPIKALYRGPTGEIITEYKNIKEGRIEDSLFQIPAGYRKMQIPGMGRGMVQPWSQ